MNDAEKTIKNAFDSTPAEIKDYIIQGYWKVVVSEISKDRRLSVEQTISMENEVLFVLLGLDLKNSLIQNLQKTLKIGEDQSKKIVNELEEKVFKSIAKLLPTEIESGENTDYLLPQSDQLIEDHEGNLDNALPKNLPTEHKIGTSLEEKIAPHVGTPGEKLNWEERKKQAGDKIIAESKYGGKDPYREPPTP